MYPLKNQITVGVIRLSYLHSKEIRSSHVYNPNFSDELLARFYDLLFRIINVCNRPRKKFDPSLKKKTIGLFCNGLESISGQH